MEYYLLIFFLIVLLAILIGFLGYYYLFDQGTLDAFYLSIITMSSLSLEIKPETDSQKLFVALYAIISIGIYLFFISITAAYVIYHLQYHLL